MDYLGISYGIKSRPALDSGFIPFAPWRSAYLSEAHRPVRIAVERQDGQTAVFDTRLRDASYHAANLRFLERTVKLLLWSVGGWRVRICGCDELTEALRHIYCRGGDRAFDADFMETVFQRPFVLEAVSEADFPVPRSGARRIGGHLNGCRIGFDAGGSDRKVSAVVDGKTVYSEEVVWHPKTEPDPQYHFDGIVEAFRTAASKMPRVDGIGVSSAGVFIGNAPMVSSLFISVPPEARGPIHTIYDRAAAAIGDVPVAVANDGDVTALALLTLVILAGALLWLRPIMYVAFDRDFARSRGIPTRVVSYLMAALVAATIVLSIRIMGIVLLISLLTIPVTVVNAFSRDYRTIAATAPAVAVAGNVAGLAASYHFEVPPGAAIIFTLTLTLIVVKLLTLYRKKTRPAA